MVKIKKYIDQEAWINRLKEEREETTNEKRKLYLTTLINAIDCRPTVDLEIDDLISKKQLTSYLEEQISKCDDINMLCCLQALSAYIEMQ